MKKKLLILGVSSIALMMGLHSNAHPLLKQKEAAQEDVSRFNAARTTFAQMAVSTEASLAAHHRAYAQKLEDYGALLSEQVAQEGREVPPKPYLQLHQNYLQDIAAFFRGYEAWRSHERAAFQTAHQAKVPTVLSRVGADVEAIEQLMVFGGKPPLHHLLQTWEEELSDITENPVGSSAHRFWLQVQLNEAQDAHAATLAQHTQAAAKIEAELAEVRAQLAPFAALGIDAEAIKVLRDKAEQLESDLAIAQKAKASATEENAKAMASLEQKLAEVRAQLAPFTALEIDAETIKALQERFGQLEGELAEAHNAKSKAAAENAQVVASLEQTLEEVQATLQDARARSDELLTLELGGTPEARRAELNQLRTKARAAEEREQQLATIEAELTAAMALHLPSDERDNRSAIELIKALSEQLQLYKEGDSSRKEAAITYVAAEGEEMPSGSYDQERRVIASS